MSADSQGPRCKQEEGGENGEKIGHGPGSSSTPNRSSTRASGGGSGVDLGGGGARRSIGECASTPPYEGRWIRCKAVLRSEHPNDRGREVCVTNNSVLCWCLCGFEGREDSPVQRRWLFVRVPYRIFSCFILSNISSIISITTTISCCCSGSGTQCHAYARFCRRYARRRDLIFLPAGTD